MKFFSKKTWKSEKRVAGQKLEHKEISEDLVEQISGGLGKGGCHTAEEMSVA